MPEAGTEGENTEIRAGGSVHKPFYSQLGNVGVVTSALNKQCCDVNA